MNIKLKSCVKVFKGGCNYGILLTIYL